MSDPPPAEQVQALARASDAVDGMVNVARQAEISTMELARWLCDTQPDHRSEKDRLKMMAIVAATALQRLAVYEPAQPDKEKE